MREETFLILEPPKMGKNCTATFQITYSPEITIPDEGSDISASPTLDIPNESRTEKLDTNCTSSNVNKRPQRVKTTPRTFSV